MPFDRYLQDVPESENTPGPSSFSGAAYSGYPAVAAPNGLQWRIPQFLAGGPPTLAAGGGVEALFPDRSAWFNNNGFSAQPVFPLADFLSDESRAYAPPQTFPLPSPIVQQPPPHPAAMADATHQPSLDSLPVYSTSGFDLLSLLSQIATRPFPSIVLGPVDMSCAFTVVDVRRHDAPIVYASPSFLALTGYTEAEVLGRNCRFLQAPPGQTNIPRTEASVYLKKCLSKDMECQTHMTNYKKDGTPFMNLLSVIPVRSPNSEVIEHHVGFQVDLHAQPDSILQKMNDGSLVVNYSRDRHNSRSSDGTHSAPMSADLRQLLANPAFTNSIPLAPETIHPPPPQASTSSALFSQLILSSASDFVHVLSLKGVFLYAAPAVRDVLGYDPADLIGRAIGDFCHPADVVPLMRELKDSSTTTTSPFLSSSFSAEHTTSRIALPAPKNVDMLFRMRVPGDETRFVWVECRGRLHVENGKGRKAVVLSGRVRSVPTISWGDVASAGTRTDGDCWGMLSARQGTVLSAGPGVRDVLGWSAEKMVGTNMADLVCDDAQRRQFTCALSAQAGEVQCIMDTKSGTSIDVRVRFFASREAGEEVTPPVVYHLCRAVSASSTPATPKPSLLRNPDGDVLQELDTARGTSWQYEMQQVRFTNERLKQQLAVRENRARGVERLKRTTQPPEDPVTGTSANTTPTTQQPAYAPLSVQGLGYPDLGQTYGDMQGFGGQAPVQYAEDSSEYGFGAEIRRASYGDEVHAYDGQSTHVQESAPPRRHSVWGVGVGAPRTGAKRGWDEMAMTGGAMT
ncbi:hypothetical protein PLICRDRAFT_360200 [Plicaturopsis crispa FD-325 SS-3]|uniref:Unplaced genomic scaffold PLICRscaffold_18, whole genome shotgun sequence n=1 Tax=Plicaturopsis crispa FD-325 SS-3 TaxID=944288 RepID=A0A0C9T822_PLICR|nr:hypothetical protein PLICRDRAFT_360200 [Plicaturopsis crispa FD-325 SS-3]